MFRGSSESEPVTNLVKTLPQEGGEQLEVWSRNFASESFNGQTKISIGRGSVVLLPVAVSLEPRVLLLCKRQ